MSMRSSLFSLRAAFTPRRVPSRLRPLPIAGALFALLVPLGASANANTVAVAATAAQAAVATPMCGSEPMPQLESPYVLRCATEFAGIGPDRIGDQGPAIRQALASLVSAEAGLFFPQGRYIVSGPLELRTGNVLVGSRVGTTNFVNLAQETALITQTFHSANKILIEGLVLDNFMVQFFHQSGSVLRYNGFRQTRSGEAQIRLTGGANQVLGNVLWRAPTNPGLGIQMVAATGSRVAGNALGADRVGGDEVVRDVDPDRVRRIITAMTALESPQGDRPAGQTLRGHFTTALQATGTRYATVDGNTVLLEAAPSNGASAGAASTGREAARMLRTTGLGMKWNRFSFAGALPAQVPSVTFSAPQSLIFASNTLDRVPLHLTPDAVLPTRPTKRTRISANWFLQAVGDTTQGVTGDQVGDTTRDDLRFIDNVFDHRDPTLCMLTAPVPAAPGRTFLAQDNAMSTGAAAKVCNFRSTARAQSQSQSQSQPEPEPQPRSNRTRALNAAIELGRSLVAPVPR